MPLIRTEESKKFVFQNREKALQKLDGVDIDLDIHPEGKRDRWEGDPALIFSSPVRGVRFSGKSLTVIGVNLFTSTSKMGAGSISFPAGPPDLHGTCPASRLHEKGAPAHYSVGVGGWDDQICRRCYALKNNYSYELPQLYQATRKRWMENSIRDLGVSETARILANAIMAYVRNAKRREKLGENPEFFRVDDSGDIWNTSVWEVWREVIERCSPIRFWIPTRMHWISGWRTLLAMYHDDRLTLRPSAYHFRDPAPDLPGFAAGTTGHFSGTDPIEDGIAEFVCPAYVSGGACVGAIELALGSPDISESMRRTLVLYLENLTAEEKRLTNRGKDCRVCWIRPEWSVSYQAH